MVQETGLWRRIGPRKNAEALIGHEVKAWTATHGEYLGILEAVGGSPWRGTVRITALIGEPTNRSYGVGQTLDIGGSNIRVRA